MKIENSHLVAERLEKYLNLAQEFTDDYQLTKKLGKDPYRIINEKSEKLKRIEAMIYVCREQLKFSDHEITIIYSCCGVKVEIHDSRAPF